MGRALMAERVRRDIDVLAHAGLDTPTFLAELDASLRRAIPHVAACMATCDPSTMMITGTYKFGALHGNDEHDHEWGLIEYGDVEATTFTELARGGRAAVGLHDQTAGEVQRSRRMRELMVPVYGFHDEARLVARSHGGFWGGIALFRGVDDEPFGEAELAFLATISEHVADGLRAGLLARLTVPRGASLGPVVMVVGADDSIQQMTIDAEQRLADLSCAPNSASAAGVIAALVAGARRYAAGLAPALPRGRIRAADGQWFVLHASPLAGSSGVTGDVVVAIEEARPPDVLPLIVAALGLSSREQDVAQLVLQGLDTKQIAAALHVSAYTVQDHLKSIFEKAGVRSRRDLVSQVFMEHYAPRLNEELSPSGWFSSSGDLQN